MVMSGKSGQDPSDANIDDDIYINYPTYWTVPSSINFISFYGMYAETPVREQAQQMIYYKPIRSICLICILGRFRHF